MTAELEGVSDTVKTNLCSQQAEAQIIIISGAEVDPHQPLSILTDLDIFRLVFKLCALFPGGGSLPMSQ